MSGPLRRKRNSAVAGCVGPEIRTRAEALAEGDACASRLPEATEGSELVC